jgi:hypothetical protein
MEVMKSIETGGRSALPRQEPHESREEFELGRFWG